MNYCKSDDDMLIKLSFRYEAECPLKNHYHQPWGSSSSKGINCMT